MPKNYNKIQRLTQKNERLAKSKIVKKNNFVLRLKGRQSMYKIHKAFLKHYK